MSTKENQTSSIQSIEIETNSDLKADPAQERCAHEVVNEYHTAGRFAPVKKFWSCVECGKDFIPRDSVIAPQGSPFTTEQHHELCLGVMADCYPFVNAIRQQAIREAIESAALLGFPVSARNLEKGGPLFTGGNA